MLELAPGYARDLASQIGFLSVFLGGFAATLFGVLLMMSIGFALGVYSLLACIGFGGRARSRRTGTVASVIAVLGAVMVTFALAS